MITDSLSGNNVDKKGKSFSEMTTEQQIEKLKKRKINFAKEMHDASDVCDKARYADDIRLIDLRIKILEKSLI